MQDEKTPLWQLSAAQLVAGFRSRAFSPEDALRACLARATAVTVPSSTVSRVAGQLLERGHIARGWLGIATQPVRLPPALRRSAPVG